MSIPVALLRVLVDVGLALVIVVVVVDVDVVGWNPPSDYEASDCAIFRDIDLVGDVVVCCAVVCNAVCCPPMDRINGCCEDGVEAICCWPSVPCVVFP